MSKYTVELRYILEDAAGLDHSVGFDQAEEVIQKAIPKIFNFDFPLFDPDYKTALCRKILLHYYTREIGFQTAGEWKLKLCTKLNDIMPYFNQLYQSEQLKFDALANINLTKDTERGAKTESNGTGETSNEDYTRTEGENNAHDISRYSDTPSTALENLDTNKYLTDATITDNSTNGSNATTANKKENRVNSENINTTEKYIEHVTGNVGGKSMSALLQEYRKTFLNIDLLVISALSDLFMLIY